MLSKILKRAVIVESAHLGRPMLAMLVELNEEYKDIVWVESCLQAGGDDA